MNYMLAIQCPKDIVFPFTFAQTIIQGANVNSMALTAQNYRLNHLPVRQH